MAGSAERQRNCFHLLHLNVLWLMRLMTVGTVGLCHRFFMRLMTIEANAEFTVFGMTCGTILFTVTARHSRKLISNLRVTTDTDRSLRLKSF